MTVEEQIQSCVDDIFTEGTPAEFVLQRMIDFVRLCLDNPEKMNPHIFADVLLVVSTQMHRMAEEGQDIGLWADPPDWECLLETPEYIRMISHSALP